MTSNTFKSESKFDNLPIALQMIAGLGLLLLIVIIGFAVFFAIDILLLDADPIGNIVSAISASLKK